MAVESLPFFAARARGCPTESQEFSPKKGGFLKGKKRRKNEGGKKEESPRLKSNKPERSLPQCIEEKSPAIRLRPPFESLPTSRLRPRSHSFPIRRPNFGREFTKRIQNQPGEGVGCRDTICVGKIAFEETPFGINSFDGNPTQENTRRQKRPLPPLRSFLPRPQASVLSTST